MSKRFALLSSTGASVARAVMQRTTREQFKLDLVITDRECGAGVLAKEYGIPHIRLHGLPSREFSDELLKVLNVHAIDYVYVFFSRLLVGKLLEDFHERLVNFHPSLLPACPGMNGFHDSVESGALVIGGTVHFIDSGVDTGSKIMQTLVPVNYAALDTNKLRHTVFSQQCAALLQVNKWLKEGDVVSLDNKKTYVRNGCYEVTTGFVPSIESDALNLYRNVLGI